MRRLLLSLLLLGSSTAALSAEPDDVAQDDRRSGYQADRPIRAEPPDRPERIDRPVMREERREPPQRSFDVPARPAPEPVRTDPGRRERAGGWSRGDNEQRGNIAGDWRSQDRSGDRWPRQEGVRDQDGRHDGRWSRRGETVPAPGIDPVRPATGSQGSDSHRRAGSDSWRRDWRQDRRYDWRSYRNHDRNRFRLGIYVDPFGWSYRRWQPGWSLYAPFYSSRYWIDDPFNYRLPPVPSYLRWVRYWDDAILVDLRTGRVIDVIPNFFW